MLEGVAFFVYELILLLAISADAFVIRVGIIFGQLIRAV